LRIDSPSINPIGGTRGAKVRQPGPVFNAAQKQGISVRKPYRSRIEDTINCIGPVFTPEDRICETADKQGVIGTWF
jgi:hypothetical protein